LFIFEPEFFDRNNSTFVCLFFCNSWSSLVETHTNTHTTHTHTQTTHTQTRTHTHTTHKHLRTCAPLSLSHKHTTKEFCIRSKQNYSEHICQNVGQTGSEAPSRQTLIVKYWLAHSGVLKLSRVMFGLSNFKKYFTHLIYYSLHM